MAIHSTIAGVATGVLLAIVVERLSIHVSNPSRGITLASSSQATSVIKDHRQPAAQPLATSDGVEPGAASGASKPPGSLADSIAAKAAEQKRFIEAASPLQGHGRQLAYAVIGLLREKDVERWIQSGIDRSRQDLNAEIDSAAPIPVIPLGPRLGLVPNQ